MYKLASLAYASLEKTPTTQWPTNIMRYQLGDQGHLRFDQSYDFC